jgi:hypothetical protein
MSCFEKIQPGIRFVDLNKSPSEVELVKKKASLLLFEGKIAEFGKMIVEYLKHFYPPNGKQMIIKGFGQDILVYGSNITLVESLVKIIHSSMSQLSH